jgi:hypothetical protein
LVVVGAGLIEGELKLGKVNPGNSDDPFEGKLVLVYEGVAARGAVGLST